ncbi:hybrid sensor histidine kinase/response regulator [Draconibacterium sp. IB214405]|uniref:hybrid sensor histidine kinase/response regulator n=1 Tax=Draconibacterium sp. IB214405 TaxID=3097352 RepID=UPI002A103ECC|nr:hybrid sensor histidine kinase/response regulator [Draconibacterium sp. IB214405]MDX8340427.1 hybrid sensor histidine kinase/response regulator [Draconibacterium sp. IB214405]
MNNIDLINLLIIDDKPENLKLISSFFEDANYIIKATVLPDEAINFCKEIEFDLILLDIRMPTDGFQVCESLKSTIKNADTPVIFMAEKTDLENISKAFKSGCRDIITKPFQLDELISKITTHSLLHIQHRKINELMSAKDKIFSIICHDMRSPYHSLIGFSDLLLENLNNTENTEAYKYSQIINKLSVKNLELLDSLIGYARNLEKAALESFEKINATSLISEVLQIVQPSALLKDIKLIQEIGGAAEIYGKKDLIATMIRNFLSNAIKFTNKGGHVSIQTKQAGDWIEIIISDNGIGIEDKRLKTLFEYGKTKSSMGTNGEVGTGYGLMLSKEIIDKHNGRITVDSQPGIGTQFKISLPKYK